MKQNAYTKKAFFTLIELLVVISILTILLSLLFPSLKSLIRESLNTDCIKKLNQITTGLFIYSGDNYDLYPADSPNNERRSPHSPALLVGVKIADQSSNYDIRPMMTPYFGNTMNVAFRCPLAPSQWLDGNQKEAINLDLEPHPTTGLRLYKLPYSLFFGKIKSETRPWNVTSHMNRLGEFFTLGSSCGDGNGKRFNILAADYTINKVNALLSSHSSRSETSIEGGNWTNNNIGWETRGLFGIDANFASDDGSVKRYNNITMLDGTTDQTYMYRTGRTNRRHFLLPVNKGI